MRQIKQIHYGGAVTSLEEERAIIRSIRKSRKSRNWQQAEEGALFEKELSDYLGTKYACLTNSGSSAGLLALSALELPKGSEVIISAVTFPTIFNIILQCNLIPVVVDCKVGTYGFDIEDVEKAITEKTRAIIAIHPLGNPVDMPALMKLVKKYEKGFECPWCKGLVVGCNNCNNTRKLKQKIYVIEDACDAFGSTIANKCVGSFGDISVTSFHAAHIISMGVGGGVFTSNSLLAKNVRMYRDWGRQADINKSENLKHKSLPKDYNPRFIYEKIGYNFQILELQAAMGRVQLRKIEEIKKKRWDNFSYLFEHLQGRDNLILPTWNLGADPCWFAFPLTYEGGRGKLLRHLEKKGIETRPLFSGNICCHPAYANSKYRISGKLDGADYIMKHSFWISTHPSLTKTDLRYIIKVFDSYFKNHG